MNKENKISIKDNFRINNINSYEIFDIADVDFLNKIKDKIELNKSLFLFDIEGEEFSVLTEKNLEILKNSYLIIEFHNCYSDKEMYQAKNKLGKNHEITRFKGLGEISPSEFKAFIGEDIKLEPIIINQDKDINDTVTYYMGKNTQARQEFIIDNLKYEELATNND